MTEEECPQVEPFKPRGERRECPMCHKVAVVALPVKERKKQTDGTTHLCHPWIGGCNTGFQMQEAPFARYSDVERQRIIAKAEESRDLQNKVRAEGSLSSSGADGPDAVNVMRLIVLKSALKMEMNGHRVGRRSVYARVKREFGLRGSKASVYKQFCLLHGFEEE